MKTALLLALFTISAHAATGDVTPLNGQCSSVKDSKVYISSDFHSYPRTVKFECTYKCNNGGKIDTLKGVSSVRVYNMEDDALLPVCQGTTLKKVPWGYDFDKIVPFYAPDTEIVTLKKWAFENVNFDSRFNAAEKAKLENLKKDLYAVASTFLQASATGGEGAKPFKDAGIKISEIADQLPENTELLDEMINFIVLNKGKTPGRDLAETLVFNMIVSNASWRVPTHLYK